jgi:voltage-gated potassium channel
MQSRLELPLLVAALLTIPAIAIEQSDAAPPWDTIATVLNWTIWTAFAGEAVLMLRVVEDRRRWVREHPLEVAIVILTPPFLPASLQAARVFRLLRLLRLLRLGVLVRRLLSTEGVKDAAVLAAMTVLGGGAAYSAVEKSQGLSAWDGAKTDAGRVIAMVVHVRGDRLHRHPHRRRRGAFPSVLAASRARRA